MFSSLYFFRNLCVKAGPVIKIINAFSFLAKYRLIETNVESICSSFIIDFSNDSYTLVMYFTLSLP